MVVMLLLSLSSLLDLSEMPCMSHLHPNEVELMAGTSEPYVNSPTTKLLLIPLFKLSDGDL